MTKYREKPATYTVDEWTGENFEFFKKKYPAATEYNKVLNIPVWLEKDHRWQDNRAFIGSKIVSNDNTGEMDVYTAKAFAAKFEPVNEK